MKRCRGCLTVNENRKRKCGACGRKLAARRKPRHLAALELPRDVYIEANDGYDGCWVCRDLGEHHEHRRVVRDHEHRGDGQPRGLLCDWHNRLLGPRYTAELVGAYYRYLTRRAA